MQKSLDAVKNDKHLILIESSTMNELNWMN